MLQNHDGLAPVHIRVKDAKDMLKVSGAHERHFWVFIGREGRIDRTGGEKKKR